MFLKLPILAICLKYAFLASILMHQKLTRGPSLYMNKTQVISAKYSVYNSLKHKARKVNHIMKLRGQRNTRIARAKQLVMIFNKSSYIHG